MFYCEEINREEKGTPTTNSEIEICLESFDIDKIDTLIQKYNDKYNLKIKVNGNKNNEVAQDKSDLLELTDTIVIRGILTKIDKERHFIMLKSLHKNFKIHNIGNWDLNLRLFEYMAVATNLCEFNISGKQGYELISFFPDDIVERLPKLNNEDYKN
jgi:hypothetical protein